MSLPERLNAALAPDSKLKLPELKKLAVDCGVMPPDDADKRKLHTWLDALAAHADEVATANHAWRRVLLGVWAVVKLQRALRRWRIARTQAVEGMKRAELKEYVQQLLAISPPGVRQRMQAVLDAGDKRKNSTYISVIRLAVLPMGDEEPPETKPPDPPPDPAAGGTPLHVAKGMPASPSTEAGESRTKPASPSTEGKSRTSKVILESEAVHESDGHGACVSSWPRLALRVMSWNVRRLTHSGERSERRFGHLAATIAQVRPAVLMVQEVQPGGGGERALDEIVGRLRSLLPDADYRCTLSYRTYACMYTCMLHMYVRTCMHTYMHAHTHTRASGTLSRLASPPTGLPSTTRVCGRRRHSAAPRLGGRSGTALTKPPRSASGRTSRRCRRRARSGAT